MKRKQISRPCTAWLCALLFVACSAAEGPSDSSIPENPPPDQESAFAAQDQTGDGETVTVISAIDGQDYTIEFARSPSRAVSLSGFTTEMMLELGLEARMAGTAYMDNEILPEYSAAYESVPVLSDKYPSREALLNAAPDFVTGWASAFSETNFPPEFLGQNQISFFLPRSEHLGAGINAVYEDFTLLGQIFRVEDRAAAVVADMQARIGAVGDKVQDLPPVSVFVYDSGEDAPYTAGASLPSDLVRLAGGRNIFADQPKKWLTVQWETVIEENPEWIIVLQYNVSDNVQAQIDLLKNTPALQDIDAVKHDRILVLGLTDVTAGVRGAAAVETMARKFHPEAFA